MTPMPPIPRAAMPVVRILRREVERPKELPRAFPLTGRIGWANLASATVRRCPMGLRHKSILPTPGDALDAGLPFHMDAAVEAFWTWWDSLKAEHAGQAVDAIWPEKGKR